MKNFSLNYLMILALLVVFTSCKNDGSNSSSSLNEEKPNEIVALFASNDPYERVRKLVGTQIFKLKLDKTEFVVGKKGTVLQIEPTSFVYEDGTPVKGEVELELGEVITMPDFIKSGISTVSDGKMLTTGGTFFIEARQGDKKLKINPQTGIRLMVPSLKKDKDMKLFNGELTPDSPTGPINWKLAEKPNQISSDDLQKTTEDLEKYGKLKVTDKDLLAQKYEDFKLFMLMIRDFKLEGEWYYNNQRYENLEKAGTEAIHKSSVDTIKKFISAYEKYISSSAKKQQLMLQKNQYLKKGLEQYKNYLKEKTNSEIITFSMLDSLNRYKKENTIPSYFGEIIDNREYMEFQIFQNYSNFYNCDKLNALNTPTTYQLTIQNMRNINGFGIAKIT